MNDIRSPFAGTRPPAPQCELRNRALRAARAATRVPEHDHAASTSWRLNRFDIALAASITLLVLWNVAISTRGRVRVPSLPVGQSSAETRALAKELGFSTRQLAALAPTPRADRPASHGVDWRLVELM